MNATLRMARRDWAAVRKVVAIDSRKRYICNEVASEAVDKIECTPLPALVARVVHERRL
eukprot:COSAG01_NODE_43182_length_432_cov_1.237237_1_plen_58_part_01